MKLYQICKVISLKIDSKDILFNGNTASKYNQRLVEAYNLILDGTYKNEEEAIEDLFNIKKDNPYFFEIKGRFRDQLLKNLFHIDLNFKGLHPFYRQEMILEIQFFQGKILIRNGLKQNAVELLKKVLQKSAKYEIYHIAAESARILKNQMLYFADIKKFDDYDKKWREYENISNIEKETDHLLNQIKLRSQSSVKLNKDSLDFTKLNLKKIKAYLKKYKTPLIVSSYYYLAYSYYLKTTQWEKTLELTDEVKLGRKKEPWTFSALNIHGVHNYTLYALLMLDKIEDGLEYIKGALKDYRGDTNNYLLINEDYFLLYMRSKNYEKASEIVDLALNHFTFERISKHSQERWLIYREYALYFCGIRSENNISSINYFPEYSKDKIGFNLQILILQLLIMLRDGEEDRLYNHIENLRYYEIRQISKAENRRAQYFLRMLRQLQYQSLDYEKCKVQSNKYFNLLKKFPEKDQPYTEIEIVSYETLWQHILDQLKNKQSKSPA